MRRHCLHLSLFAAILFLLAGCSPIPSYFQKGNESLKENPGLAAEYYLLAIAYDDHALEAHRELSLLCQKSPARLPEQIWHLQRVLELSPEGAELTGVQTQMQEAQEAYFKRLKRLLKDAEMLDLQARIKLLEEHSLRQKQWIDDLTLENQTLRKELAKATTPNK